MLQTKQNSRPAPKTERQQDREKRQPRKNAASPLPDVRAALQAVLSGAQPQQIPAEGFAALSRGIGNAALLDIWSRVHAFPERSAPAFPVSVLDTEPAEWDPGGTATPAGSFSAVSLPNPADTGTAPAEV